eukprot:2830328-Pyramimonas_sp.AAC.1
MESDARLCMPFPGIGRAPDLPDHRPLVATPAAAFQPLRIPRGPRRSHFASSSPSATHAPEATSATSHAWRSAETSHRASAPRATNADALTWRLVRRHPSEARVAHGPPVRTV